MNASPRSSASAPIRLPSATALLAWVAAVLCACTPAPTPRVPEPTQLEWGVIDGTTTPSPVLRDALAQARAAGAGEGGQIAVGTGATGDRITALIEFPTTDCALLTARAGESVTDVDLFAYGDDGTTLGVDEAADDTPVLLVCPPHPRRLLVSARIASGHGVVAIGAHPVAPKNAEKVARKLGVPGAPGGPPAPEVWPGLDARVEEHRAQIGGSWNESRRMAVPLEPQLATRVSAAVEGGGCLDILIVPAPEVAYLDVSVQTFDGRIVGRAAAAGRTRSLVVCADAPTPLTVSIRPRAGRGLAAVVLSRSRDGTPDDAANALRLDVTPLGPLPTIRAQVAERRERAGYGDPKEAAEGKLVLGRRTSVPIQLPQGCSRVDVLLGAPGRGFRAWLWTSKGQLIGQAQGGADASIFACGPRQEARLDLEPVTIGAPYLVELRAEPRTPQALVRHPLAAHRLVQRLVARGVLQRAGQVSAAEELALDPTQLIERDVLVPVGRCVDIAVALGPEALGVELRLVDADSGDELEYVNATSVASARACSLDRGRTLNVRAEMRTTVAAASGLYATRMLSPQR